MMIRFQRVQRCIFSICSLFLNKYLHHFVLKFQLGVGILNYIKYKAKVLQAKYVVTDSFELSNWWLFYPYSSINKSERPKCYYKLYTIVKSNQIQCKIHTLHMQSDHLLCQLMEFCFICLVHASISFRISTIQCLIGNNKL